VATGNVIDRLPLKLSLRTACERLAIEVWSPPDLIAWVTDDQTPDENTCE
jgi:hypothetical protein